MEKNIERREADRNMGFDLDRVYLGMLAFILAGVVIFNVVSSLSALPGYCGLCHKPLHTAWKNSPHADIKCNVCHSEHTAFGEVSGRIMFAKMIPAYVSGFYRRPVTARVPNNNCLQCHSDIETGTLKSGALRVSHKEIIGGGYDCTDCHSTVAHGKATVRQNFTELSKCLTCHNDTTAPGNCELCHVETLDSEDTERLMGSWQISHGKNWRKTHGMGDIATCKVCHSTTFCSRCHTVELPHTDAWLTTHGGQVKASATVADSCKQCHKSSLCKTCHKIQMPHPQQFLSQHSALVKKDGATVCYNCHYKETCTACHKDHAHRGIPQNKLKLLRKEAGLD